MPPIPAMVLRYAATRVCAGVVGLGAQVASRGLSSATAALQQAATQPGASNALSSALLGVATIGTATSQVFAGLGHVLSGR